MNQFRGPISLVELERALGDFDRVRLRTVDGSILSMPEGHKQLTTLGNIWPCGCETRGSATPATLPACWISPCAKHISVFDDLPIQAPPGDEPAISVVMSRAEAAVGSAAISRSMRSESKPSSPSYWEMMATSPS
jgi:hypothetical protein